MISVPVSSLPYFHLRYSLTICADPDEVSQPNEDMFDMILAPKRKPPSRSRSARATQPIVVNEDDDDVPLKPRSKKLSQREPSPVHVQIQPLKPNRRRQQKSKPIEPLFLESDEDAEMRDGDADLHDSARVPGDVIDLSQDDDLDDGTTLPSVASSQQETIRPMRASSRKKAAIRVQEGDSDDDIQFKGFGRRRR